MTTQPCAEDNTSKTRCSRRLVALAMLCALSIVGASASEQVSLDKAWKELTGKSAAIRKADLAWDFQLETRQAPLPPEKLKRFREQQFQSNLAQGMTKEEAERETELVCRILSDTRPRILKGTKRGEYDGTVVWEERKTQTLQKGKDAPIKTADDTIECITTKYGSRFHAPFDTTFGEIYRLQDEGNPFGFTGGMELDPIFLSLRPLTDYFTRADVVGVADGGFLALSHGVQEASGKWDDNVALYDLATGVIRILEMRNRSNHLPFARYSVTATKVVGGITVPSTVIFESLEGDGSALERTVYKLTGCRLNDKAKVEGLERMGPLGSWVIDYRLGHSNPKKYRIGDKLPPELELANVKESGGIPLRGLRSNDDTVRNGLLFAFGILFFVLGIREFRRRAP